MADYMRVEDLDVYRKLCELHIEVSDLSRTWPADERDELGSQIRRSSNSAPANLAERHRDRHVRNKIEGANRARGEALETIHHLYVALLKGYVAADLYGRFRARYPGVRQDAQRPGTLPGGSITRERAPLASQAEPAAQPSRPPEP